MSSKWLIMELGARLPSHPTPPARNGEWLCQPLILLASPICPQEAGLVLDHTCTGGQGKSKGNYSLGTDNPPSGENIHKWCQSGEDWEHICLATKIILFNSYILTLKNKLVSAMRVPTFFFNGFLWQPLKELLFYLSILVLVGNIWKVR